MSKEGSDVQVMVIFPQVVLEERMSQLHSVEGVV